MTRKLVFINDSNKSDKNYSPAANTTVSACNQSDSLKTNDTNNPNNQNNNNNNSINSACKCSHSKISANNQFLKQTNTPHNKENKLKHSSTLYLSGNKQNRFAHNSTKQSVNRLVTTFEELSNLDARSRHPIDIMNASGSINRFAESSSSSAAAVQATIETTRNRKYFSFMTTNRQFLDLNKTNESKFKFQLLNYLSHASAEPGKQLKKCFSSSSSKPSSSFSASSTSSTSSRRATTVIWKQIPGVAPQSPDPL